VSAAVSPPSCRVAVDEALLDDADSARRGLGTVARHLLPALADVDGIEVVPVGPPGRFTTGPAWRRRVRRTGASVFLGLGSWPPPHPGIPLVQTLYDVIPLVDPDPRFDPARRLWASHRGRWTACDRLVAISRWSAGTGVAELGLDPGAVDVVPLAPAEAFTPAGPVHERSRPYLALATTWGPHKGVEVAMAAVDVLVETGHDVDLVVAGDQLPYGQAQLEAARSSLAHPDRVDLVGWVADLAALYRGAACVVVPSRAEGFGLPAVEAMACGAPVVAASGTGLAEAAGDGADLVPAGDAGALAAAVERVLVDDGWRAALVARGHRRVEGMTWARVAAGYAEVLRAAAATRSSATR
jgi:glycosyltransferase involved in cell wall biosynthesis